jgi:stage IV sporulation protein FB
MTYFDQGYKRPRSRWQPERLAVYLFTFARIDVSIHVMSILLLAFQLLEAGAIAKATQSSVGEALGMVLALGGMVFLFVLLHEFGHCFGCRYVGGRAEDILMWPLGGLAYCEPPDRPWENLVTTACGPAVNLAFCLVMFPFLLYSGVPAGAMLNPFGDVYLLFVYAWWPIAFAYKINYWLFVFNVFLPVYPMDGGRLLQALLWFRKGKWQSTYIACNVGMFAGAVVGFVSLYNQNLWIFFIMLWAVIHCYQTRAMLAATVGERGEYGDFSEGYTSLSRSYGNDDEDRPAKKPGFFERMRIRRDERRAASEAEFEGEIDRILNKVHEHGLGSLTNKEKKLLNEASERRRKRGY